MNTRRLISLTKQIRGGGPVNSFAVALMLTEMRFRGRALRGLELIYALWLIYVMRREPRVTLGKCQVSFEYWRRRFGKNNLALFRGVLNDLDNYRICCDYLDANRCLNVRDMLISYNGRPSVLYVRLFYHHLAICDLIVRRLKLLSEIDRASPKNVMKLIPPFPQLAMHCALSGRPVPPSTTVL
jgi:hypothetical protein